MGESRLVGWPICGDLYGQAQWFLSRLPGHGPAGAAGANLAKQSLTLFFGVDYISISLCYSLYYRAMSLKLN
jgi:hypothetical protein